VKIEIIDWSDFRFRKASSPCLLYHLLCYRWSSFSKKGAARRSRQPHSGSRHKQ